MELRYLREEDGTIFFDIGDELTTEVYRALQYLFPLVVISSKEDKIVLHYNGKELVLDCPDKIATQDNHYQEKVYSILSNITDAIDDFIKLN